MSDSGRREALVRLSQAPSADGLYLAGGVAVAHHCGHRLSADLDLFSHDASFDLQAFVAWLERHGASGVEASPTSARMTLHGVPVDIMRYPYPLLEVSIPGPEGFATASRRDLAAMKLAAITHRAARRDFWDVRVLADSGLGLMGCVEAFVARFHRPRTAAYDLLKQLTSVEDAERGELLPLGMTAELWDDLKGFFLREAPRVLREWATD